MRPARPQAVHCSTLGCREYGWLGIVRETAAAAAAAAAAAEAVVTLCAVRGKCFRYRAGDRATGDCAAFGWWKIGLDGAGGAGGMGRGPRALSASPAVGLGRPAGMKPPSLSTLRAPPGERPFCTRARSKRHTEVPAGRRVLVRAPPGNASRRGRAHGTAVSASISSDRAPPCREPLFLAWTSLAPAILTAARANPLLNREQSAAV